uniref:Vitamin K-dependent protein C n=1 Tax=Sphaeramia orbicularis TaxID=375764 RepID=A0A672YQI8_9TELE
VLLEALHRYMSLFFLWFSGDHCSPSPCQNGATCTSHASSYTCKCAPGYHGRNCDKVRLMHGGCRHRNGGCEHFCSEFSHRRHACTCAPGYHLDLDNSTCTPEGQRGRGLGSGRGVGVINGHISLSHDPLSHDPLSHDPLSHDPRSHDPTEQKRRVDRVLIHPGYNQSSSDSDLALLRLYHPVKLGRYVVPICLPARNSTATRTLATVRLSTVSGWGRLAVHGSASDLLQRLEIPRVPLQECRLHTRLNITRNMLCAGVKAGGKDSCEGDSGGPLVTKYRKTWFLTGVVSWGKGCAHANMYGVYTKVSNFLPPGPDHLDRTPANMDRPP